jgi:hypothetical protein
VARAGHPVRAIRGYYRGSIPGRTEVMTFEIKNTYYTTLDRRATFCFDFVQVAGGEWRIYIRQQPDYNGRADGTHQSHRLSDARGRYICWAPAPRSLDQAKGVARAWADATYEYIRTGVFPPPGPEREVPDVSSSSNWEFRGHVGEIAAQQPRLPARNTPPRQSPPAHTTGHNSRPGGLRGFLSNWRHNR